MSHDFRHTSYEGAYIHESKSARYNHDVGIQRRHVIGGLFPARIRMRRPPGVHILSCLFFAANQAGLVESGRNCISSSAHKVGWTPRNALFGTINMDLVRRHRGY